MNLQERVFNLEQQLTESKRDLETIQRDNLAQYDRATRAETDVVRLRAMLEELVANGHVADWIGERIAAALAPPEATAGERGG